LSTTVIAADGTTTREGFKADANAPIDCFYVYPTVSTEATMNSDMTAGAAERTVVRQQFARFGSVCRLYAPLYRQVTVAGLRGVLAAGGSADIGRGLAYGDVRDAWRSYLEHDNHGRGVVLIGHSQGSFVLTTLLHDEIDGTPVQSRLVSAILAGATVPVPKGEDVGGAFQHIPVCRANTMIGCVIVFASFRATAPPPAATLFGHVQDAAMTAACANPAALAGGSGVLHAYFSSVPARAWIVPARAIETPFVSVPGLLTARCATNEHATYLEVTVHGDPSDPRADDIPGDLAVLGQVQPNWGLHLVDINLTIGNLVDVVRDQTKRYQGR
jgi:pimeloyl-ACP methyl ester carboxylesterase